MRIWVTGCAGFIGSHLCQALRAQGHSVGGNDDLSGGSAKNIDPAMHWLNGRCQDIGGLPEGIDVLVHCAALAHEGLSVFSPKLITESVYGASVSMFSAAIAAGVKRIVFLSSMSRYGDAVTPFDELERPRPVDPYGIAKVAAEQTLRCLSRAHGVEYVIAVPHSVYGPRQCLSDPYRNVVAIFMNRIAQGKRPIVYGDGNQRRNFTYITDALPSLLRMVQAPYETLDVGGVIFNIGPDEQTITITELVACCYRAMEVAPQPAIHVPGRPCEVDSAWCSSNKARRVLGYRTETSLAEGLNLMAAWVKLVGPQPFEYKRPIEIQTSTTPTTWTNKEI